jgi:cytosine/adenosine deaminase-related metal-dependent hydrolase
MSATTVIAQQPAPSSPLDTIVSNYIALRDKIAEIKDAQAKQLGPYNDMMTALEALLLDALLQTNAEAMRTNAGSFYKTTHASVKVKDWATTLAYIQQKGLWELLEARVSKVVAQQIVEDTQAAIPGIEIDRMTRVNVRRPD